MATRKQVRELGTGLERKSARSRMQGEKEERGQLRLPVARKPRTFQAAETEISLAAGAWPLVLPSGRWSLSLTLLKISPSLSLRGICSE